MERKSVLITGCAGFIGFHASKNLLEKGYFVVGIDNLNDYYDINLKKARLNELKKFGNFKFYKRDISKGIKIKEKVDQICHLAAQPGVGYSLKNPLIYEKYNNLGTLQVFEFARMNGIKSIVYASSSSIYGDDSKIPLSEEDKTDHPISLYAATKKTNELYAYAYHKLYGIHMDWA